MARSGRAGDVATVPRRRPQHLAVLVVSAAVLAVCWAVALHLRRTDGIPGSRLDVAWAAHIDARHTPALNAVAQAVATVGGPPLGILIGLVVAVVIGLLRGTAAAAVFTVAAALSEADVLAMKWVARRPTPEGGLWHGLGSFPSGHTANAAVIAVSLGLILDRARVWVLAAAAVLTMAVDRTYLDAHWLTDTVAGTAAGTAVAVIAWFVAAPRLRVPRARARPLRSGDDRARSTRADEQESAGASADAVRRGGG